MFDIDGSLDKCNTTNEDLLMSNENKDQHDPFEFLANDLSKNLPFSRLLFDANIWE
jgi:hypothetical protein